MNTLEFHRPTVCVIGLSLLMNGLYSETQEVNGLEPYTSQLDEDVILIDPSAKNVAPEDGEHSSINNANRTLMIETMEKSKPMLIEGPKNSQLMTEIRMSGIVEVEGYWQKQQHGSSQSDIEVATAQLDFSGRLNPQVEAFISLLYEEPVGGINLDVAKIDWKECLLPQLSLSVGKDYLAFNNYDTLLISNPLVLDLSEASETNLKLTWQQNWAHYSATVYRGDNKNRSRQLNNYVLEAGIQPCPGFSGSISYNSNIFESDILQSDLSSTGNQKVGGFNGFTRFNLGDVSLLSEFTIASRNVKSGELLSTRYSCKPQAYRIEADLAVSETLDLGLAYEGSADYEPLPERRYGLVARKAIKNNFGIGLELLQNQERNNNDFTSIRGQLRLTF